MKILEKIKALRKMQNLTQKAMSEKLHLSEAAYNKIENGETELSLNRLSQIADILGVSAQDLTNNSAVNIIFSQKAPTNGIVNNNQNDFIEYLKNQIISQKQEIEDKNLKIQQLQQEIMRLLNQKNE